MGMILFFLKYPSSYFSVLILQKLNTNLANFTLVFGMAIKANPLQSFVCISNNMIKMKYDSLQGITLN